MKAAMLLASMSRAGGGLFTAASALSRHLAEAGVAVEVLAGEDEFSQADRPAWEPVPVRTFRPSGPRAFGYLPGLAACLDAGPPDLVHLHGLWTYPSAAALRWSRGRRRRVVSPHGMLDPWALRNSAWKKRVAGFLYEGANLRGAACLHALCQPELEAFRAHGLTGPAAIIPNGVDLSRADGTHPPPPWASRVPDGAKRLLYLGRLHPKKGLLPLVQGFGRAAAPARSDWHLVIAGWDQGGHAAELRAQAADLGLQGRVHLVGPQFGADQRATLAAADAFVLPSLSEGLPMAVLEAWAFGRPVVMTPECNLPVGFSAGAALETRADARSLAASLDALFSLSDAERAAIGRRGRALVEERFDWRRVAADMAALYGWVLGGGPAPDFVELIGRQRGPSHAA
ncbi:glycosyltransferase [Rubellimicrobium aerolatum]|uniref:Glycosyltransferase n=1 Tax=Rubellimicrobium aerolatum TaxID=490979 RepID=A0ABW0S9C9_9RHOB|nr:glycosyltransferase [Rubellimicrobium aerolatum]MBP1804841.1 poly(glycerol-phosphate) alpha-glucosyltransferase [Rubellimicrobium aerolatum]